MDSSTEKSLAELCEKILKLISEQGNRIDKKFNATDENLQAMGVLLQTVKTLMDSGDQLIKSDLSDQQCELAAIKSDIEKLVRNQNTIIQILSMLQERTTRVEPGRGLIQRY